MNTFSKPLFLGWRCIRHNCITCLWSRQLNPHLSTLPLHLLSTFVSTFLSSLSHVFLFVFLQFVWIQALNICTFDFLYFVHFVHFPFPFPSHYSSISRFPDFTISYKSLKDPGQGLHHLCLLLSLLFLNLSLTTFLQRTADISIMSHLREADGCADMRAVLSSVALCNLCVWLQWYILQHKTIIWTKQNRYEYLRSDTVLASK